MNSEKPVSVLFVCMGNICRSPTAEGVFRKLVVDAGLEERILVDSAGTHAYHTGEQPDRRAQAAAERRGVSLKGIRARRVADSDFLLFDYILAMDEHNLAELQQVMEASVADDTGEAEREPPRARLGLFLDYARAGRIREVPDPYYGGTAGFERVLDLVEDAAAGLLDELRKSL